MFKPIDPNKRKSKLLQFRVTESEYIAMKNFAENNGNKLSSIIRIAVINHFNELGVDLTPKDTINPNQLTIKVEPENKEKTKKD